MSASKPAAPVNTAPSAVQQQTTNKVAEPVKETRPTLTLDAKRKTTSGLSLKSIRTKKEHQIRQMDVVVDETDLPKDTFNQEQLINVWGVLVKEMEATGKLNLASILSIDVPKAKGNAIQLEFPNATNKIEVERAQYEILGYIRKELNNFDIHLDITINEEMVKQYAYTSEEQFEKLKEKNPAIDLLKKTFGLDF